eukprot:27721-Eustigmatos_ZCMA.PRE.1
MKKCKLVLPCIAQASILGAVVTYNKVLPGSPGQCGQKLKVVRVTKRFTRCVLKHLRTARRLCSIELRIHMV